LSIRLGQEKKRDSQRGQNPDHDSVHH
jgi:hypothetical protein